MKVTCVVADPQEMSRKALVALLRTEPCIEVVGDAATVEGAARAVRRRAPALLILDTRVEGLYGSGTIRDLCDRSAGTALLALVQGGGQRCLFSPASRSSDAEAYHYPCCSRSRGAHTIKWTYDKDGSVTSGSDRGDVDNIRIFLPSAAQAPLFAGDAIEVPEGVVLASEVGERPAK